MQATEAQTDTTNLLNLPYVELSFGVVGKTLPADHGYGLYSAIAPLLGCDSLIPSQMPQGVEHYARIGTLFQSLNLRCRKALITGSGCSKLKLSKWLDNVCANARHLYLLYMRECERYYDKVLTITINRAKRKKSWNSSFVPRPK